MSSRFRAVIVGLALVLGGCATAVPYQPSAGAGQPGYSDEQLAQNRWRVTFTGNSATPRETVENYLLLRSAEVTIKAGYHWFVFDTRNTEAKTTYHSDFMGWPGWRGYGWYWHTWPYGPPYGPYGDVDTFPVTRYQAYAEIVLLTDEQAKSEPRAIRAQDVLDHIGPTAHPPASPPPQ